MALWFNVIHIPIGCFALYALFDVLEWQMLNGERERERAGDHRKEWKSCNNNSTYEESTIEYAKQWFWVSAFVFVYYITYYDSMNFSRFKPHRVHSARRMCRTTLTRSASQQRVCLFAQRYLSVLYKTIFYFPWSTWSIWSTGRSVGRSVDMPTIATTMTAHTAHFNRYNIRSLIIARTHTSAHTPQIHPKYKNTN